MTSPTVFLAGAAELAPILRARNVTILNSETLDAELDSLERADLVAMWLSDMTPLTLLKLGLAARSERLVVGCAEDCANIAVICSRFGIPLTRQWSAFVAIVCAKLAA